MYKKRKRETICNIFSLRQCQVKYWMFFSFISLGMKNERERDRDRDGEKRKVGEKEWEKWMKWKESSNLEGINERTNELINERTNKQTNE